MVSLNSQYISMCKYYIINWVRLQYFRVRIDQTSSEFVSEKVNLDCSIHNDYPIRCIIHTTQFEIRKIKENHLDHQLEIECNIYCQSEFSIEAITIKCVDMSIKKFGKWAENPIPFHSCSSRYSTSLFLRPNSWKPKRKKFSSFSASSVVFL